MERVVSVNLNGNSYQLDESAYDALRAYLGGAETALADNPDKAEIIRDLEQAIADKFSAYLFPYKNVVSAAEMKTALEQMGPVEGGAQPSASADEESPSAAPRRKLYRIRDRDSLTGVSAGLAAYAQIDPGLVRAIWILGAIITGGAVGVPYLVLAFMMPPASTTEDIAAAHGAPFNAQDVIERAKREYQKIADETTSGWRREQAAWRRQWRESVRPRRGGNYPAGVAEPMSPIGCVARLFAGLFAFIFSIITAVLLIALLIVIFALLSTGAFIGWTPLIGAPIWLAIVIICIVFAGLFSVLHYLRRAASAAIDGGRPQYGGDGLITLLAIIAGIAFAYQFLPEFRAWIESFPNGLVNLGPLRVNLNP
jgi:phage shock protein PspC (stress-responsive transcriptional regulator)